MYKGDPTAFHFPWIFCIWDDNTTVEVSVAMAVAAFYSQDAESTRKKKCIMKNVTQITAIACKKRSQKQSKHFARKIFFFSKKKTKNMRMNERTSKRLKMLVHSWPILPTHDKKVSLFIHSTKQKRWRILKIRTGHLSSGSVSIYEFGVHCGVNMSREKIKVVMKKQKKNTKNKLRMKKMK